MRIFFVFKISFYDLRIMFVLMRVIDKKIVYNRIIVWETMYFEIHIKI